MLLHCCSYTSLYAQTTTRALPVDSSYLQEKVKVHSVQQQDWEKATKGLDYSTEKKQPEKKEEQKKTSANSYTPPSLGGPWVQFLLFGAIIIGLIFLLIKVISSGLFLKNTAIKNVSATSLENLEENLHESDLDQALRDALMNKDYRLALRIYYLAIIKELSLRHWIKWKKDKTNYEYVHELEGRPQAPLFSDITSTFERAWYGDVVLDEEGYRLLSPFFSEFIDALRNGAGNG